MKCKIICDLLPLYIDGVCSDETKEMVEQHIKACSECSREYEKMKMEISMNKAEDLDEKKLLERGKETMTEYVKEKIYQRWILGDTILNMLIIAALLTHVIKGIMGGADSYHIEMLIFDAVFPALFFVSDIIYWVRYLMKRESGISVIIDTICKISVWTKLALMVCAVAAAAIVGFDTLLNG